MISNRQALFERLLKLTDDPYFSDLPLAVVKGIEFIHSDISPEMSDEAYKLKFYQLALLHFQYEIVSDIAVEYWKAVNHVLVEICSKAELHEINEWLPDVIFHSLASLSGSDTKKFPDDWFDFSFHHFKLAENINIILDGYDLLTRENWQLIVDHSLLMTETLCEPYSYKDEVPKLVRILLGIDNIIKKIKCAIPRKNAFIFLVNHFDIVKKIIDELNLNDHQLVNKENWLHIFNHELQLSRLLKIILFLSEAGRLNQENIDWLLKRYGKCLDNLVMRLKQYDSQEMSDEQFNNVLYRPLSLVDTCRSIFTPYIDRRLLSDPKSLDNVVIVNNKLSEGEGLTLSL